MYTDISNELNQERMTPMEETSVVDPDSNWIRIQQL